MSVILALPLVKYASVSYYLELTGSLLVARKKYRFLSCTVKNHTSASFNTVSRNFCSRPRPEEPPWRILFFGTDQFSLACLQPLFAKLNTGTLLSGLGVISSPHSIIYKFAEAERLPIHSWPPDDNVLSRYDMGIVVSYGKLIPENIINGLPLGILNVHGSLLPRWRGAAPIAYAIMHGDGETGVTVMRIKPHKFDVGDIVRQYRCSISPNDTTPELTKRLEKHAGLLLMECIRDVPRCLDMATPQPKEGVTHAPKLDAKLSPVNWKKMSAQQVYNLHRGISYKYPLSAYWFGKLFKLDNIELEYETLAEKKRRQNTPSSHRSALEFLNKTDDISLNQDSKSDQNINSSPGLVKYNYKDHTVKIQCADGKWILCRSFKPANGRAITSKDFYNGYLVKQNPKDWYFT